VPTIGPAKLIDRDRCPQGRSKTGEYMREAASESVSWQVSLLVVPRLVRLMSIATLAVAMLATAVACGTEPALAQTIGKGAEPTSPARALPPLELVKSSMTRVLAIAQSQRTGALAQRREMRLAAEELFDFNEMSRRMLGQHWNESTREEQAEFVRLFTDLLERSYLTALAHSPLVTITFEGESVNGPYAQVSSQILVGRRGNASLEYRLLETDGRWAVYDIVVDGVSLVLSYRSQFNSILRTSRFTELLDRLRSREASVAPRGDQ
jgi:phospholipid transport system substrate-binding protein